MASMDIEDKVQPIQEQQVSFPVLELVRQAVAEVHLEIGKQMPDDQRQELFKALDALPETWTRRKLVQGLGQTITSLKVPELDGVLGQIQAESVRFDAVRSSLDPMMANIIGATLFSASLTRPELRDEPLVLVGGKFLVSRINQSIEVDQARINAGDGDPKVLKFAQSVVDYERQRLPLLENYIESLAARQSVS
jgi:hypothetical protein